ncbi:MAG: triose-phosphate isomerase [Phycisphaerales bacterium]|nr:triose-phosphate isomerase [Phycisphaerales bacterium]
MSTRKPYVGGNWKMNTGRESGPALAREVASGAAQHRGCEVAVFPPFPFLLAVGEALGARDSGVKLGAQDCYFQPSGAFTGEVSIGMLQDCGVAVVLTGHSERRHVLGETDAIVNAKTKAVLAAGLECVLCIGELLEEREAGKTDDVNERQLRAGLAGVPSEQMARLTIAYEPVWAIGTGRVATAVDAQDVHRKIRVLLGSLYAPAVAGATRILYGGSLKASNASELLAQPDIDGGLVGGASLQAAEFLPIIAAAAARGG